MGTHEAAASGHATPTAQSDMAAFRLTPDLRFVFPQAAHEKAFADIAAALRGGAGLVVAVGEPGLGKTTLLRRLESELRSEGRPAAYIAYPELTFTALMSGYCAEFGLTSPPGGAALDLDEAARFLSGTAAAHQRIILIDDADRCANRLLSDLHELVSRAPTALQVVLGGGSGLALRLMHDVPEVGAAIAVHAELSPLAHDEVEAYLRHRLRVAGARPDMFAADAISAIFDYSRGVPRLINQVCGRAVILARRNGAAPITMTTIAEAVADCPAAAIQDYASAFAMPGTAAPAATPETAVAAPAPESPAVPNDDARPMPSIAPASTVDIPASPRRASPRDETRRVVAGGSRTKRLRFTPTAPAPAGAHDMTTPVVRSFDQPAVPDAPSIPDVGNPAPPHRYAGFVPRRKPAEPAPRLNVDLAIAQPAAAPRRGARLVAIILLGALVTTGTLYALAGDRAPSAADWRDSVARSARIAREHASRASGAIVDLGRDLLRLVTGSGEPERADAPSQRRFTEQ